MDGLHRVLLATVAGVLFTLPSLGGSQVAALQAMAAAKPSPPTNCGA